MILNWIIAVIIVKELEFNSITEGQTDRATARGPKKIKILNSKTLKAKKTYRRTFAFLELVSEQ